MTMNRGYGAALRTGFEAARFEFVAFTDADCQFYLDDLGRLLTLAEDHPIAVGWRRGAERFAAALFRVARLQRADARSCSARASGTAIVR